MFSPRWKNILLSSQVGYHFRAFFKEINVKHQKKYGYDNDKKRCFYQHITQSFRHRSLNNQNFPNDWNLKSACSIRSGRLLVFSTSSLRDVRSENRMQETSSLPKWRNIAAWNWEKTQIHHGSGQYGNYLGFPFTTKEAPFFDKIVST